MLQGEGGDNEKEKEMAAWWHPSGCGSIRPAPLPCGPVGQDRVCPFLLSWLECAAFVCSGRIPDRHRVTWVSLTPAHSGRSLQGAWSSHLCRRLSAYLPCGTRHTVVRWSLCSWSLQVSWCNVSCVFWKARERSGRWWGQGSFFEIFWEVLGRHNETLPHTDFGQGRRV